MPGMIYEIKPGQPEIFDGWIFPGKQRAIYLGCEELNIARIILVHGEFDGSATTVFEKDIDYGQVENRETLQTAYEKFINGIDPDNPTASVLSFG